MESGWRCKYGSCQQAVHGTRPSEEEGRQKGSKDRAVARSSGSKLKMGVSPSSEISEPHYLWGTVLGAGNTGVKDKKIKLSRSLHCSEETPGMSIRRVMSGGDVCCGGDEAVKGNGGLQCGRWLSTGWRRRPR